MKTTNFFAVLKHIIFTFLVNYHKNRLNIKTAALSFTDSAAAYF